MSTFGESLFRSFSGVRRVSYVIKKYPRHLGKASSFKEEVICRINQANSALFAGLIWQIVSYLPDYFPANNALFAGLIRQIVSYLPDYENEVLQGYIYGPVRYWSDKSRVTSQE